MAFQVRQLVLAFEGSLGSQWLGWELDQMSFGLEVVGEADGVPGETVGPGV